MKKEKININELVGMRLSDALKILGGRNVKLGAQNGSGCIYCDIVPEKYKDAYNAILRISTEYKEDLRKSIEENKNTLLSIETYVENIRKKKMRDIYGGLFDMVRDGEPTEHIDIDILIKEIDRECAQIRKDRVNMTLKKIKILLDDYANFRKFPDRIITETYMSITEDKTVEEAENKIAIIISFEGKESGRYWDRSEYISGKGEDDEIDTAD